MTDIATFVDRYINIWNEPDRRAPPPDHPRTLAGGRPSSCPHARSRSATPASRRRVANAYEKWVKEKGNVFRLRDGVDGHHGTIKLRWEMLPAAGGEVISIGFDFLVLGEDGRIRTGYQFIEA